MLAKHTARVVPRHSADNVFPMFMVSYLYTLRDTEGLGGQCPSVAVLETVCKVLACGTSGWLPGRQTSWTLGHGFQMFQPLMFLCHYTFKKHG